MLHRCELQLFGRSDYNIGHLIPVRRSSSLVGHRELAELSRQQLLIPNQGNRQLPAPWEQELLKMKLASTGFGSSGRPSSTGSATSSDQPDLARASPRIPLETSLTAALARLSPQAHLQPSRTVTASAFAVTDQLQQPTASTSAAAVQDQSFEVQLVSRKSITSPFLAAAQKFYTRAPQLAPADQQEVASQEASPSLSPEQADASEPPELAAETSAGEQEAVLLALGGGSTYDPNDRFSLDNGDPRLEMRHSLATSPINPPSGERFLTADSFKNEPGQTLFDCTDPTPNQSTDLDDIALKARLAPFLPNSTSPSGRRVRRQLSSQFGGVTTWPKSRNYVIRDPDPNAIASADAELGVIDEAGSARASKSGGMQWDRGHSLQSAGADSNPQSRSGRPSQHGK